MHVNRNQPEEPLPDRPPILFVVHPDQHVEIFADHRLDIHFARIPMAFSLEGERQAEEVMEMMLPKKHRDLYRADWLQKTE